MEASLRIYSILHTTNILKLKNINYKDNRKINNITVDKKGIIDLSPKKSNLMNGGIYYFSKKIFNCINNEYSSLENDIINKLIIKKRIIGKFYSNRFIDIGHKDKLNYLRKNLNSFK